jgi:hypothetical protein
MAEGELGAVFRGLAKDAATAGRNAAQSIARFTEKTAAIEERNVADLAAADARAVERLRATGRNGIEAGEGASRGPWPVAEGVAGPAKGKELTAPNKRHTISGAKHGEVKVDNTVALRGHEDLLKEDTLLIAGGCASYDKVTQLYKVNGRTYQVKSTGTVFPVSGPGLVQLSRPEYLALRLIARADGDVGAVRQFQYNPHFSDNPDLIAKAKAIYDGTYVP